MEAALAAKSQVEAGFDDVLGVADVHVRYEGRKSGDRAVGAGAEIKVA